MSTGQHTQTPPPTPSLALSVGNDFLSFNFFSFDTFLPEDTEHNTSFSLKSSQLPAPPNQYCRHCWTNVIKHRMHVWNTCWPLKQKQEITSSLGMLDDCLWCSGGEGGVGEAEAVCLSVCECVYVEGWGGQRGHRWLSCLIMIITTHLRPHAN